MPTANVDALRRGYEALNSGDLSGVHALLHPDIEWQEGGNAPEAGIHQGRDTFESFLRTWLESFDTFRIEPEEIEAVLSQYPGLREAVVIARANGVNDKELVAYVVKDNGNLTYDELQGFLAQRLPVYMIPTRFVALEKLPLTPNGKIDRAALPAPEKMRPALQEEFIAPKTPVEKLIAGIWCEVLEIDQVGLNDNFFKLGAHSLLATKVATRLREAFQQEISLGKIFESPTVAEIAAVIEEGQAHPKRINDFEIERLPRGNADMAQVLAELANLSEHEAQSLLMTETHANSAAK